MKTIADSFFITTNDKANQELPINGLDGKPLWVDPDFNKYHRAVQYGWIETTPYGFSDKYRYEVDLKKGDKVYTHHFVVQPENKYTINDQELFLCHYDQIFCIVREKKIIPIEDWLFAVPKMESEEDIKTSGGIYLKLAPEPIPNLAIVKYVNAESAGRGIKSGDEVFYMNDADYDMKVEGEKLYRMKNNSLIAKYIDGELAPFDDNFILEVKAQPNEVLHPSGIVIVNLQEKRQQIGIVWKIGGSCNIDYSLGDEFIYFTGQGTKIKHGDKYYLVLKKRDVSLDKAMVNEIAWANKFLRSQDELSELPKETIK